MEPEIELPAPSLRGTMEEIDECGDVDGEIVRFGERWLSNISENVACTE